MKVLVVYYGSKTTFIQRDIDILSKHYDVDEISVRRIRDILDLTRKIRRSDLVFIWFAGKHAGISVIFARIFGKRSIVVVGGYDAAKVPEIEYGLWQTGGFLDKILARYSLKRANRVLVVDPSLKEDLIRNAKIDGTNIMWVPTGYDANFWKYDPVKKKEDIVLTVSVVKESNVKRKGLETFVKAARFLPEVKFVLIGKFADRSIEYLKSFAPSNVEFTGFVSTDELLDYYQRAKVYCQLSRYEGLPNALCEAMLCECVPVGTRYCGIPRAIGDTGFYVEYGDEKATADAIKNALKMQPILGKKARERISQMFPEDRRERELMEIINSLLSGR